ncbi:uncharacterized protein [Cicer arietinum]|uniref:uncharacterized protein n=1 Tax=Cicer arietinum TaxID=3827 RepID=UPI003CC6304C
MCIDHIISRVLIDNGSSLNVISKSTLAKLPCDGTYMRPSPMVVRAFDGSRREVMGEIDLPIQIGPVTSEITFHVMDIVPAYREGDLLVSNLSTTPYVETTKDALETAFQTLEIVDTAYVETTPIEPHMSNTAIMVAKFMLSRGHHPWHGLGKDEEGLKEPVELPENRDKWGLGYKPTRDDKRRLVKEKKEKRLARIENREPRIERIPICDIRRSFQSARPTSEIHIAAAEDDMFDGDANWIRPCGVGAEIRNWKVVKSPMIFNAIPIFGNSSFTDDCTKISLHNLNHLVSQTEKDNEEDYEPPLDLLRAVERETQGIMPFEEPIEFSRYNQIKMAAEDMEKTTFTTPWGTFCYKVMPFGLKNAGATYQRAMVTLFHDMIHKEVEVYVDDMIAKSQTEEEHIIDLKKLFKRLRKFKLKLNPSKCTFGVRSGKVLGFVVSQRGIEVDPDKIRAIAEMPLPSTEKEVCGFLGRLNYISRFISQLTATCEPIFKLLRKNQTVVWNQECQNAFEKIRQYLQNPPILAPPVLGRPLIMYLTVLDGAMGCVLGQHDETGKKEHAIYYLSKKFTDAETRYTMLERTCCALAWAAHRLRQYMLCHTTYLISKMDPIKYIFEKPALTGRIARWQVMLSEYDITYVTQKAIKGSALADYLANQPVDDYKSMQCEFPDESIMVLSEEYDDGKWTLLFDGTSNIMGHGIGVVLISPKKKFIPITARLCFDCTNNMGEYEACAMRVLAALESKAKVLEVYGDSTLVINQLNQEWETRDKKLIPYFTYTKELSLEFDKITFHHVPREDNQLADALATLSSMFQIKMESRDYPAYFHVMEEETDGKPWYHDIKHYLINREYPPGISENEKRTLRRLSDYRGKWTPNYEGPYVVKKAFSGGALILTNMDGKGLALPVNSDAVKKYYA